MSKSKKSGSKQKSSQLANTRGRLEISRSGMAFVIVEDLEQDIMVRPNNIGRAFHGDTVKVEYEKPNGPAKKGWKAGWWKCWNKQSEFLGHIEINRSVAFFIVAGDKPFPDFFVPLEKLNGAKDGDHVIVRLVKWDKDDRKPQGEVITVINANNASDLAMKEILVDARFPLAFEQGKCYGRRKRFPRISRGKNYPNAGIAATYSHFTIDPVDAGISMTLYRSVTWITGTMRSAFILRM